jgi:hypothetical protein
VRRRDRSEGVTDVSSGGFDVAEGVDGVGEGSAGAVGDGVDDGSVECPARGPRDPRGVGPAKLPPFLAGPEDGVADDSDVFVGEGRGDEFASGVLSVAG